MTKLYKINRKPVGWWTRERVNNGLKRFALDYFRDSDADLPQYYFNYRHVVPLPERRACRRERLYPPFRAILRHYKSLYDAWTSLGYRLEYRPIEFWTRTQVVEGLKTFHRDFNFCPTNLDKYREKQEFTGKFVNGKISTKGYDQKYPSQYGILKHFNSMREAWKAAGFEINSWWEPWSADEDWFILETVGVLPRTEVAAFMGRTVPAIKRRLYDLGRVNSMNRWGISVNRGADLMGVSRFVVRKYMSYGIIPFFRGNKLFYLNPADLVKIQEFDWSRDDINPELAQLVRTALIERTITILKFGEGWREREIYKFEKTRDYRRETIRKPLEPSYFNRLPPVPNGLKAGDAVILTARVRQIAMGRQGIVRGVYYSPHRKPRADGTERDCWIASVEFSKIKKVKTGSRNLIRYNLPLDVLALDVLTPPAEIETAAPGEIPLAAGRSSGQKGWSRARYEDRKAKGLCQWCDSDAELGRIRCAVHRQITADYNAGRRDIRLLNGLCGNCGKNKVSKFTSCRDCRHKKSKILNRAPEEINTDV